MAAVACSLESASAATGDAAAATVNAAAGVDVAQASSATLSVLLRQQLTSEVQPADVDSLVAEARAKAPPSVPERAQLCGSLLFGPPLPVGIATRPAERTRASEVPTASAASRPVEQRRRYEEWLCGAALRALDAGNPEEWREALAAVAKRQPVLMRPGTCPAQDSLGTGGAPNEALLLPTAAKWDASYLREHMGQWSGCHVLRALNAENKYLYYFDKQPGRDMSESSSVRREASEDLKMSLADFLDAEEARQAGADVTQGAHYLQMPLVERNAPCGPGRGDGGQRQVSLCPGMDSEMLGDWRGLDDVRLGEMQREGQLGAWSRSQLFVGPAGTLSPVHYDQYDNLFLQVRGAKHFLLFDPWAAEGLYPYPTHHPYDEYARLDLESVDAHLFPRARAALAGRGVSAIVEPGEVLFIPSHWWHHVCGESPNCNSADGPGVARDYASSLSISLNFWFDSMAVLRDPPLPLPDHLELELARHIEFFACILAGPPGAKALSEALTADVSLGISGTLGPYNGVPLEIRDFVLLRLLDLLGKQQVAPFIRAFLAPERFR